MNKQVNDNTKSVFRRAFLIYLLSGIFAIFIIAKIVRIQFVEGEELRQKALNLSVKYIDIHARRGNIYACDGSLLATSVPRFDVHMDLSKRTISEKLFNENVDSLAWCLSNFFGDHTQEEYLNYLWQERKRENRYMLIGRNLDYFDLLEIRKFPIFNKGQYKGGFIVEQKDRRENPFNMLARRTIGFVRENYYVGIEGAYDSLLRGTDGKRLMKRVSGNIWLPVDDQADICPEDGKDIVTTIDIHLQEVAETALYKHLMMHDADHGCVVLMEVQTGEVKAIANLQKLDDGSYYETYNYAVGESFEPGSSFKLMSLIVGLEDKKFSLDDMVATGNGKIKYANQIMSDSHQGGFGTITIRQAFEYSSNVGISKVILKEYGNNPATFIKGLYKLGINKPLGLEIKGEGKPFIKSPDHNTWSRVSLPWMSIGYELRMTPMQILAFYNAVANDGKMMKPMFVKEIQYAGQTVKSFDPVVLNPAIASKSTIALAQSLLEGVVLRGTAKNLNNAIFPIAGKTATALIAKSGGYRVDGADYNASFVGYFPANDPQYSCIVVINKPSKGKYYGGTVAAPVFLEIAEKVYATNLEMRRRDTLNRIEIKPANIFAKAKAVTYLYKALGIRNVSVDTESENNYIRILHYKDSLASSALVFEGTRVPDVCGMTAPDAVIVLESFGLKTELSGKGRVSRMIPSQGTPIRNGMKVKLILK